MDKPSRSGGGATSGMVGWYLKGAGGATGPTGKGGFAAHRINI